MSENVNLRDLDYADSDIIRSKTVYRSSEVLGPEKLRELGIKSIIDLRETKHTSLKEQSDEKARQRVLGFLNQVSRTAVTWMKQKKSQLPRACKKCSRDFKADSLDIKVYHAGIIQPRAKGAIFWLMPTHIKCLAICKLFCARSPKRTVEPAVPDPELFGYAVLYAAILDNSKARIAIALRIMLEEENLPAAMHCTHGKDRTGIIVMLLLLLCNVSTEAIEQDYSQSEIELMEAQKPQGGNDEPAMSIGNDYMRPSNVSGAKPKTIRKTIQHMNDKYGSVNDYMRLIGLSDAEIDKLRHQLCKPGKVPVHSTDTDTTGRSEGPEFGRDQ